MINKDQIQNIRIKRLRIIFPLIALVIVSLIFFQSVNIATTKDKNLNLILSDQSNDGVLKPSMIGETSSGQPFVLNALKASPLGPDLRDIELENVADRSMAYTPVPGGVGPMTINTLILQTIESCEASLK